MHALIPAVRCKWPCFRSGSLVAVLGILALLNTACAANTVNPVVVPPTVRIPAGSFVYGSDLAERNMAYDLDARAYGHQRTREQGWYDTEPERSRLTSGSYRITRSPITNEQYHAFIARTGHPAPDVDRRTWRGYGLVHPWSRTRKFAWTNNVPPAGRGQHPVVLISYHDARAYATWLSEQTGKQWHLPSLTEWERAARGDRGHYFPWGDSYASDRLNSHDDGPFDTVPVGARGAPGPHGLIDAAGQVFEWIATPDASRAWVKGGSWDDKGCGVCRPAARHSRPKQLKHILIGFRLVRVESPGQ